MALETDKKVLNEIYREGRLETDRQRRIRLGLEMIEQHHTRASADFNSGELAALAEVYFTDHRGQYPSIDEVASMSSSDPVWYVGQETAWLMKAYADMVGKACTYSQVLGNLEKRAATWLNDLVDRRQHGARQYHTGTSRVFPGTRVGGPDEDYPTHCEGAHDEPCGASGCYVDSKGRD